MASFLDKVKIKTAVEDRNKFDYGCDHISTADWMQFNVAFNKELVPRERIDVSMETFTRMLPLVRPTFGRANINNRAFFVPYRTIFPGWNDFITDSPHVPYGGASSTTTNLLSSVPTFKNGQLLNALVTSTNFGQQSSSYSDGDYYIAQSDSTVDNATSVSAAQWLRLRTPGRQVMKILQSLGYTIVPDKSCAIVFNALPLLAVAKIYIDWYWPSAYDNTVEFNLIKSLTKRDNTTGTAMTDNELYTLLNFIKYVNYDSDYFVSAWDNPTAPNDGMFSQIKIPSIDNSGASASGYLEVVASTTANDGGVIDGSSPHIRRVNSASSNIMGNLSQYVMDSLKKLTDYMKRHQLVGSKAIDRYLARYGVTLSAEKTNRSVMLGHQVVPLQIGDVTSQSATTEAGLGDFAGKGLGYGQGHFDYETEEYGQFVIISTIIPAVGYYQGIDRNVLHIGKLDFWTPEFDSLGTQAISKAELYISNDGTRGTGQAGMEEGVFGYTPRYAEYKVGHDRLTGDYRYNSINTGEDAWYLMRNIDDIDEVGSGTQAAIVHNLSFVQGIDRDQYDRIFQNGTASVDLFRMIYHFEVAGWSPMKPLFETYDFDDNGQEVTQDVNGVKAN